MTRSSTLLVVAVIVAFVAAVAHADGPTDPVDTSVNLPQGSSGVAAYGAILSGANRRKAKRNDDDAAPAEMAGVDADNDDAAAVAGPANRKLLGGAVIASGSGEGAWWHRGEGGTVVMHDQAVVGQKA